MKQIRKILLPLSALLELEDPDTDPRLLPGGWRGGDNSRRMAHYRRALEKAMECAATPLQKEQLMLYFEQRMTKTEIARSQGRSCSSVSKSIRKGLNSIRDYMNMYMEIYDALEAEFLKEE